jgi:hypothetical protein
MSKNHFSRFQHGKNVNCDDNEKLACVYQKNNCEFVMIKF